MKLGFKDSWLILSLFSKISVALTIFLLNVGRFLGVRFSITAWGIFFNVLAGSRFTALWFIFFSSEDLK